MIPTRVYRLKCVPCAVQWSGYPDSRCFICDGPGVDHTTLYRPNGQPTTSGDET